MQKDRFSRQTIVVFIAVIIALSTFGYLYIGGRSNNNDTPRPSPTPSATQVNATGRPSSSPYETFPTPSGITSLVPMCELKGEIIFYRNDEVYSQMDRGFSYSDVGDPHSIVQWVITPQDEVRIGPNRFSSQQLPAGDDTITLLFANRLPAYDNYVLHASIDYPAWDGEKTVVRNVVCNGEINLNVAP